MHSFCLHTLYLSRKNDRNPGLNSLPQVIKTKAGTGARGGPLSWRLLIKKTPTWLDLGNTRGPVRIQELVFTQLSDGEVKRKKKRPASPDTDTVNSPTQAEKPQAVVTAVSLQNCGQARGT